MIRAAALAVVLSGCSWLSSQGSIAKTAVVDCTKGQLRTVVEQFAPVLDALLVQAVTPDGKVNWQPLEGVTKNLGVAEGGCVLSDVVAQELHPKPTAPGAPKASELVLDAASLRAGYEQIRKAQFGGAVYVTSAGPL